MDYDSALFAPRFSKYLPGLVGAGLGSIAAAWKAGKSAYSRVRADYAREKFPTWRPMAMLKPAPRRFPLYRPRYAARSRYMRRYRAKSRSGVFLPMVRSSVIQTLSSLAAGTRVYGASTILLQAVQTSDLLAVGRLYRIKKVVLHVVPRVDVANSGLANNFQAQISACNDPEDSTVPTSVEQVTAYDNSRTACMTSGSKFTYTFYPRPINSIQSTGGGAVANVGSYSYAPWIQLNATGIAVPHNALKWAIATASATTASFDYWFDIHFDVKGIA